MPPEPQAIFCWYVCIGGYILLILERESDSFNGFCLRTADKVKEPEEERSASLEGGIWPKASVVSASSKRAPAQSKGQYRRQKGEGGLSTKTRRPAQAGTGKMSPFLGIGKLESD